MKIVCTTLGTRGDIQPFVALAKSLSERGHDASVATHPWAAPLLEFYNVKHIPLMVEEEEGSMFVETGGSLLDFIALIRNGINGLRSRHKNLMEACADCDLVIGHYGVIGLVEAELLNKPYITFAILEGAVPRKENTTLGGILKDIPSFILQQMASRPFIKYRKELGLPEKSTGTNRLTLLGLNELLVRKDDRWLQPTEMVGFQFLPPPVDYKAPVHLVEFLERGEKPLFITFGSNSLAPQSFNKFFSTLVAAVQSIGMRAVVQIAEFPQYIKLPDTICRVESVPYPWLLPKVSLVVYHGGYGTLGEVLREGLPFVLIPQAADQFARSKELYEMGLSYKPLNWKKVTHDEIVNAISNVRKDDDILNKIKMVGERIRNDAQTSKAVEVIENYFKMSSEK